MPGQLPPELGLDGVFGFYGGVGLAGSVGEPALFPSELGFDELLPPPSLPELDLVAVEGAQSLLGPGLDWEFGCLDGLFGALPFSELGLGGVLGAPSLLEDDLLGAAGY